MFDGDFLEGVGGVDEDGEGVIADDELHGLLALFFFNFGLFLGLHGAAAGADVAAPFGEFADADAGAAAGDGDFSAGEVFRPGGADLGHGVGAGDLDGGGGFGGVLAAAGAEAEGEGGHQGQLEEFFHDEWWLLW